jgi:hypothetical protein
VAKRGLILRHAIYIEAPVQRVDYAAQDNTENELGEKTIRSGKSSFSVYTLLSDFHTFCPVKLWAANGVTITRHQEDNM